MKKILIVDDEESIQVMLRRVLERGPRTRHEPARRDEICSAE